MDILRFPLARLTACFIPGIVFAHYLKPSIAFVFVALATTFAILLLAFFVFGKLRQKPYFAVAVYLLSFASGTATQTLHGSYLNRGHYIHRTSDNRQYALSIVLHEKLRNTAGGQRYISLVDGI